MSNRNVVLIPTKYIFVDVVLIPTQMFALCRHFFAGVVKIPTKFLNDSLISKTLFWPCCNYV